LLEATERKTVFATHPVVPYRSRPDSSGEPVSLLDVIGEYGRIQSKNGVIGEGESLVFVGDGDYREDRTENFLTADRGGVVNVAKHRRFHEESALKVARPAASSCEDSAFRFAACDQSLNALTLPVCSEWTHLDLRTEWIADRNLLELCA
jgi:hypothetical protein